MALNIKSPETDALARRLSALAGESITETVTRALAERLARFERRDRRDPLARRLALRAIRERVSALPELTDATDDAILGYDADGVFG